MGWLCLLSVTADWKTGQKHDMNRDSTHESRGEFFSTSTSDSLFDASLAGFHGDEDLAYKMRLKEK